MEESLFARLPCPCFRVSRFSSRNTGWPRQSHMATMTVVSERKTMTVSTVVLLRAIMLVYMLRRNTAATTQYARSFFHSSASTSRCPASPSTLRAQGCEGESCTLRRLPAHAHMARIKKRYQRITADEASCTSSSRFWAGKRLMASCRRTCAVMERRPGPAAKRRPGQVAAGAGACRHLGTHRHQGHTLLEMSIVDEHSMYIMTAVACDFILGRTAR